MTIPMGSSDVSIFNICEKSGVHLSFLLRKGIRMICPLPGTCRGLASRRRSEKTTPKTTPVARAIPTSIYWSAKLSNETSNGLVYPVVAAPRPLRNLSIQPSSFAGIRSRGKQGQIKVSGSVGGGAGKYRLAPVESRISLTPYNSQYWVDF